MEYINRGVGIMAGSSVGAFRETHNVTEKEKCQFVLKQLTGMSALCHITTLEQTRYAITGPHTEWVVGGVLMYHRVLVHLDLSEMRLVMQRQSVLT